MKAISLALAVVLAVASSASTAITVTNSASSRPPLIVMFSPNGHCRDMIVAAIDSATNTVLVQEYTLTAAPIIAALCRAKARGVCVECVLDAKMAHNNANIIILRQHSITVMLDGKHCCAHNKVLLIDGHRLICGSYNLSEAAETCNAENVLDVEEPTVFREFWGNYLIHAHHSR